MPLTQNCFICLRDLLNACLYTIVNEFSDKVKRKTNDMRFDT